MPHNLSSCNAPSARPLHSGSATTLPSPSGYPLTQWQTSTRLWARTPTARIIRWSWWTRMGGRYQTTLTSMVISLPIMRMGTIVCICIKMELQNLILMHRDHHKIIWEDMEQNWRIGRQYQCFGGDEKQIRAKCKGGQYNKTTFFIPNSTKELE